MKKNNNIAYLSSEFLLWLYWKSCDGALLILSDFGLEDVVVSIEEIIALNSIVGDGYSETVKALDLTELQSIRDSIKLGRLPEMAKVKIACGELEWSFQLKSTPFKISALKLPITGEKDENQMISVRLNLIAKFESIMKALFNAFLLERESPDFIDDLKEFLGI